ncbi:glycine/betaine ABC transporter [Latilactobacillus graminis]|uniref:BCCT transporter family protein n=3 Tax=Latilactobacillus graminis TaxID=60519 RepID=A0AA89I275_9LACO|nr:BCCT transporter family protein [Latilactobacillus graminis DSM 20719]QFP80126.1 glycine/betaine ABC transporter [Latilactobacillus graminis]
MLLFGIVSALLMLGGDTLQQSISQLLDVMTTHSKWLYIGIYIINFIFLIWLGFSRYGRIRLGRVNERPEYNDFQWGSMVFATGIDASILMLSTTDPLQYLQNPPFGAKPFSAAAYRYANVCGQFNWGPMAWMIFATATIAIGYAIYVKKIRVQRLSAAIDLLEGPQPYKKILRELIDFTVVFGIMGGIGSSIGMEIPVISKVLSTMTGLDDTIWLKLALFGILLILFTFTVYAGLNKGIKKLSAWHIYTAIGFLLLVLFIGPTLKLIGAEGHDIFHLFSNFGRLSLNQTGTHSAFAQHQTLFYWGWWLAYMPVMGLFIARISRGRTIRQVLLGMATYGAISCMSFYAILGGYALFLQRSGQIDLVHLLNTQGQATVIAAVITTLPFKIIMLAIFCLSCFIFLATTISSSAFIVSSFTSLELKLGEQPNRWNRMAWVVIFILFSLGIVLVGSFKTIQAVCVIAGFPLIFVCALLLISIFHNVHSGILPVTIKKTAPDKALKSKLIPKFFL